MPPIIYLISRNGKAPSGNVYSCGFLFLFLFQNGAEDVKKHRWFKTVDWDAVPLRKLKVSLLS